MGEVNSLKDINKLLIDNIERIKEPVDSIVGNAELILHEDTNSKIKNSAYEINILAKQLNRLAQDLRDVISINQGGIELADEEYEFDEIILHIRSLLESKTARTGARFTISVDKNISFRLRGDQVRIADTLAKFVDNAVKVSGAGRITFSAESVSVSHGDQFLRFSISDSGDGKVSDELATTIAIADSVAKKMKGKLAAKMSETSGSTYTLLLVQGVVGDEVLGERVKEFELEKLFEDADVEADHILEVCEDKNKEGLYEFIKNGPTRIGLALHYINDRDYKNYLKTMRGIIQLTGQIGAKSISDSAFELEKAVKYGKIDIAQKQTAEMSNYILKLVAIVENKQKRNTAENISGGIDRQSLRNMIDEINRNLDEYKLENVEELYYELSKLIPEDEEVYELLNEGEEHLMNFDVTELKKVLSEIIEKV